MKRAAIVLLTIIPLFFTGINHSYAQQKAATGSEYNFILGEWVGENSGKPGQGFGSFTFKRDLDGNILIR
ncbi:MAG: hypothetical protein Q8908_12095, partial [Bacteroidota bacterium]|nr:hypothetical protein [Bacteroidota bacterium]